MSLLTDIIENHEANQPAPVVGRIAPAEPVKDRGVPPVPILATHQILAEAVLRLLPHVVKADKDCSRPKLCHLVIEADGTMAATTGHTLAAFRHAVSPAPGTRVLIELPDTDAQAMCRRLAKRAMKQDPLFGLELAPSGSTMTLSFNKESMTITPAMWPDEYPEWRKVVRVTRDAKSRARPAAQLSVDPAKLARFRGTPVLSLGGAKDAIVITYPADPSFFGLIMPCELPEEGVVQFPGYARDDDYRSDDEGPDL